MFEAPGSSVKYVLVTEKVAKREEGPIYLGRGQGGAFHTLVAQEEGDWEEKQKSKNSGSDTQEPVSSFENWRLKTTAAAGSGG